jgi:uncharacterized membrane protein YecN with MAPEG domain
VKQNDIIIAKRQKQKAMAWSDKGDINLALVTAFYHNQATYILQQIIFLAPP